jgi:hypothetical protein
MNRGHIEVRPAKLQNSILPNFRERARARTRARKSELFKPRRAPIQVSVNSSPSFRVRARARARSRNSEDFCNCLVRELYHEPT